jgi:hypothetical protein
LISLCRSNHYIDENFCNSKDASGKTVFHYLLKSEFDVDVPIDRDARSIYVDFHQNLELRSYPTIGILLDAGTNWKHKVDAQSRYMMLLLRNPSANELARQAARGHALEAPVGVQALIFPDTDIIDMLWKHPINLYLLASVYAPSKPSNIYRISLMRLIRDPTGEYVSSDDQERFSLNIHPQRYNPIVTSGIINPNEIPIIQRVIHYTSPYLETLPFLYNKRIMAYDQQLLSQILIDLARTNSNARSRDTLYGLFPSMVTNPKSIPDFMQNSILSRVQQAVKETTLDKLATVIVNNEFPETLMGRFYKSYQMMQRSLLLIILEMLLLFSGAVVIQET